MVRNIEYDQSKTRNFFVLLSQTLQFHYFICRRFHQLASICRLDDRHQIFCVISTSTPNVFLKTSLIRNCTTRKTIMTLGIQLVKVQFGKRTKCLLRKENIQHVPTYGGYKFEGVHFTASVVAFKNSTAESDETLPG